MHGSPAFLEALTVVLCVAAVTTVVFQKLRQPVVLGYLLAGLFRVKIWRRLQRLGAVAIKNSVYVLPRTDPAREDFEWVRDAIVAGGGDASICEARFVEGLSDEKIEALFHGARDADYGQIAEEAKPLAEEASRRFLHEERRAQAEAQTVRLRRRFDEIAAIDFFGASGREPLDELLSTWRRGFAASPGAPERRQPCTHSPQVRSVAAPG